MAIDRVDHDERGIHDDAREGHHSQHRKEDHIPTEQVVSEDRADGTEWNHTHDDEGLKIGPERDRQEHVDDHQRHAEALDDATGGVGLFALLAAEPIGHAGKGHIQFRSPCFEGGDDATRCRHAPIHVRRYCHNAPTICPTNARKASGDLRICNGSEGHLDTVPGSDAHFFERTKRTSLCFGVANHHTDIVAPALDALGLGPVESLTNLARQVVLGEAQGQRALPHRELYLLLSRPEGVRNIRNSGKGGEKLLDHG